MICGSKAARVGGNIFPSKFLERNSSHRNAGKVVKPDEQYTRHTNSSKLLTFGGSSLLTSSDGILTHESNY